MTGAGGPVRVLHAITRLIVGGAQENTLFTAARLDPDRYRVDVLSGPQTGAEGSLIEEARAQGIQLTILPDLLRQVSPLHDLRALAGLARFIRAGGYTIVHTHSSKAGILGRLAARQAGAPVVVHTVHGWSFHDHMPALTRQVYILLERWMARLSDALVVVAQNDLRKGLQAGIGRPEQYHLIRSAIPLKAFNPKLVDRTAMRKSLGLPLDAPVVGALGRFSEQKNPLDWVRVAGIIGRARPEARFLLVGDGPLRPQVQAALAQEGLAGRAVLTGLRRDAPQLLAAMDVFLLTSLWEGLPRTIPEAQAMGLPVVANQVDGANEAIQHGVSGFLCQPGDVGGAARQVLALLDDPLLRAEMGARGRAAAAAEFDLNRMIHQSGELYDRLLSQKRA
jgi:glycosyltransferase involved in cell wall biosynthesis